MADDADRASELEELEREDAIRQAIKPMAPGVPGDCDLCGSWSGRLVSGACAPCRDKYKLP